MKSQNFVSVIILTHNSINDIKNCIKGIEELDYENLELIIVDNDSSDGTRQFLTDLNFKNKLQTRIILNSSNLGYNLGNLSGIKISKGDFIAIINPDVTLEKSWLKNIMKSMEGNSKEIIVCGKILNSDETTQTTGGLLDIFGATSQRKNYDKDQKFFYHPGSAFVFRKSILNKIDLDPNLFMYYEDVDLAWQTRLLGYDIAYCEDAQATHKIGQSLPGLPPSKFFNIAKNRIYVCAKNYSQTNKAKRIGKIIFLILGDSIYYSYKFKSLKYFYYFFKAIFWNIINLKKMKIEREKIQKLRVIPDKEIEKFMMTKSIEVELLSTKK